MLKSRVRLLSIWSLQKLRHPFLPSPCRASHSILKCLVEADRKRHWLRPGPCDAGFAEIVYGHTRDYDLYVSFAQGGDSLAQAVMLVRVLGGEEGDLNDWDVQGVCFRVKC